MNAPTSKHVTDDGFPSRLRAAREKLGLTQQQSADRTGMARQLYARLEAGGRRPSLDLILRLATALVVDPNTLAPQLASTRCRRCRGGLKAGPERS